MILDSNLIIYAAGPEYPGLRRFIQERAPSASISIISYIEVLGFPRLTQDEKRFLREFFQAVNVLPLSEDIAVTAAHIRQQKKVSLGDAVIAATALRYGSPLFTRNVQDFSWIRGLRVIDPMARD